MTPEKNKSASSACEVVLTGIVIAIDWDDNGNPLMIGIAAENEKEYVIDETEGKGAELRKLLQKRVMVSGIVASCLSTIQTIVVQRYEPQKDFTASTLFSKLGATGRFNPSNACG